MCGGDAFPRGIKEGLNLRGRLFQRITVADKKLAIHIRITDENKIGPTPEKAPMHQRSVMLVHFGHTADIVGSERLKEAEKRVAKVTSAHDTKPLPTWAAFRDRQHRSASVWLVVFRIPGL